uniref:Transcriptional repressor TUP1 n=1 Tax=Ganoderma boninense TaxID=34458 RepID=A0A5K1JVV7_9APHY|nr:Transcriptional repressor TUP1 [Ganoderma boninense]
MRPPMRYQKAATVSEAPRHTGGVAAVAFSPNGKFIASAGLDCKLCIWKASDGNVVHIFVGASAVLSLAWVSQDLLLCGMRDGSIAALAMTQLHAASFPRGHNFPVEHLATDQGRLASGSHEELAVWERGSYGQWKHKLDLPHPPRNSNNGNREVLVTSIHWTKSKARASRLLVTYMYHGYVIYDTQEWRLLMTNTLNGFT